ncbi:hypothetical protein B296_00013317 [Ensete ventricosum]|uniref:Ionotropic glutamate receptor C-terminal domain-containing protein n=1 Tax=Ensete ventricosum TaxID=4639 RepID=A0A427AK89_ENSVE|nr:hypothetical protein B296_00013317 [Ensete ventricosum]
MEKNVIAVVGPQSSGIGHVISHVVNELHVPLLSFAATDPTLSPLEFPYFIRTTHSDYFQMNAIADLVEHFGWREVTAIYVDDHYGRGGVIALGDALARKRSKISYKAGFPPGADSDVIRDVLAGVNLMESRVYVVHVNPDSGLGVFSLAKNLGMLTTGYVWIATDWLASDLDSFGTEDPSTVSLVQGVIVLRHHTPDSDLKRRLTSRWRSMIQEGNATASLNSYGLYAYDSVWLVARAIDRFLSAGQIINFSVDPRLHDAKGSSLRLATLRVFDEGERLLHQLLLTNFTGVSGRLQFDSDRNLVQPAYDILNIQGTGPRLIGYWSNDSGLSVRAPEVLNMQPPNASTPVQQQLHGVVWPGETRTQPRGWVFRNNGKPLRIGVPNKSSFTEIVWNSSNSTDPSGFCIDVFNAAVKLLPYPVPCKFIAIGDGSQNPNYDDIVSMVARNATSLTSILTVQQLSSGITGLDSLLSTSEPIGYQKGKFSRNYMIEELNIPESRLVPLNSPAEYARALRLGPKGGGVAAIVDEIPYAFQRDSPLAVDLSTAILALSENGDLQRIHEKWLSRAGCSSRGAEEEANRLSLSSFWGLFLLSAIVCLLALILFCIKICYQYAKYSSAEVDKPKETEMSNGSQHALRKLKSIKALIRFFDMKEEEINKVITKKPSGTQNAPPTSDDGLPSS